MIPYLRLEVCLFFFWQSLIAQYYFLSSFFSFKYYLFVRNNEFIFFYIFANNIVRFFICAFFENGKAVSFTKCIKPNATMLSNDSAIFCDNSSFFLFNIMRKKILHLNSSKKTDALAIFFCSCKESFFLSYLSNRCFF